jgi:hypothetical protein
VTNRISARYFKQVMPISEVNGRISELRSKGIAIETSKTKDRYGFAYHRLAPGPSSMILAELLTAARQQIAAFDAA